MTAPITAVDQVHLSVHQINNLPKAMQQLDPNRVHFELVVQATAKYYITPGSAAAAHQQGSSVARLDLNPLSISFSSSSILYRKERFVLDLEAAGPSQDNHHQTVWKFPSPQQTFTVLEVFIGVKERRVGSSTSHWISTSATPQSSSGAAAAAPGEQQGVRFLVPLETIYSNRVATKFVGLSIGQVAVSFSVVKGDPGSANRLRKLVAQHKPKLDNVDPDFFMQHYNGDEIAAVAAVRKMLNPNYFRKRVEKLVQLYTPDQVNTTRITEIMKDSEGREEDVVRLLSLELGPELSCITCKHRLAAFMKKYKISDSDVAAQFPPGGYNSSILETDTERVFETLSGKYGTEPRPTSYMFPPVAYEPDRRTFLMENLSFPVNKPNGKNYRDIALAARQKRIPFVATPNERELNKTSRSGRQLSEIEILQEKHDPEFKQIIPAIAESLTNVLAQHAQLSRVVVKDDKFAVYETNSVPGIQLDDYVHRIAEYTYISPASMVGAVIFLDRLCERYNNMLLTDKNIFKLFFVAVRVASKVVDLRSLNNKNFASVGGVGIKHLNDLEEAFLKHMRFDLFLSPIEFTEYARRLHPPLSHSSVPRHLSIVHHQQEKHQQ